MVLHSTWRYYKKGSKSSINPTLVETIRLTSPGYSVATLTFGIDDFADGPEEPQRGISTANRRDGFSGRLRLQARLLRRRLQGFGRLALRGLTCDGYRGTAGEDSQLGVMTGQVKSRWVALAE